MTGRCCCSRHGARQPRIRPAGQELRKMLGQT
jgi:hypothetical protein